MPKTEYVMVVDVAAYGTKDISVAMVMKITPRGSNVFKVLGSEQIRPCNSREDFEAELKIIKDKYENLYPNIKLIEA